ncbi:unnamed protein product [Aphanomyces euteiches]
MFSPVESLLAQASPQEYYPFSLYDAATRFPFTIGPLLPAYGLNSTSPQPITPNNRVVLYDLNYFDKTEALLNKTSLEDLKTVIELGFKADWLDEWTRTNALTKLSKIASQIGGPEEPQLFNTIDFDDDEYLENHWKISRVVNEENIGQLGKPINKKVWQGISAQDANANYVPSLNRIVVPAAILQPPFFDLQADPAQNFGGVGMVIGHELISARQYNGPCFETLPFQSKAHCIVEQYGNFTTRSETTGVVIGNVDRHLTLGETIGDNGGLKASFLAYQEYMKTHESKHTKETGEKLFFLSFAQGWCSRNSDAALQALLQDEHPPNRFRVFGALQNNFDFSRVFNCPADTFMNPAKKCPLGIGMSSRMQTLRFMII